MSGSAGRARAAYWAMRQELTEWGMAVLRAVPGRIGQRLRAWGFARVLGACGKRPVFMQHVVLDTPRLITLGDDVRINRYCQMQGAGGISIGNGVLIGPAVLIWSSNHVYADPGRPIREQGYKGRPVVIEDDVWIGGARSSYRARGLAGGASLRPGLSCGA